MISLDGSGFCPVPRPQGGRERSFAPSVDLANNFAVNDMSADHNKRSYRIDFLVAAALVTTGLVMAGLSLAELGRRNPQQVAQATQPLQSTPGAESKPSAPREPVTTGTRPSHI